jgi:alpha-L-rhamnosidase
MHGTYFMTRYLTDTDQNDLIYSIVSQKTFPGWGYMLENGATTIWEEWDGDNSHIHDTLLSVGMWFVQGLAGIQFDPEQPGFKHIRIRPAIVGDLTHATGTYDSLYGQIQSGWQRKDNDIIYEVTIPPNTTASIMLPTDSPDTIRLGDAPLQDSSEVSGVHSDGGRVVFEVGSGSYTLTAPAPAGT